METLVAYVFFLEFFHSVFRIFQVLGFDALRV